MVPSTRSFFRRTLKLTYSHNYTQFQLENDLHLNFLVAYRNKSDDSATRVNPHCAELHNEMWRSFLGFMALYIVTASFEQTAIDVEDSKSLYLMYLSRDKMFSWRYSHMVQFSIDTVNNDTRLLPGYDLQVVTGFTAKSVSFTSYCRYCNLTSCYNSATLCLSFRLSVCPPYPSVRLSFD